MDASRLDAIGLDPSATPTSRGLKKASESVTTSERPEDAAAAAASASGDRVERSPELKARLHALKQALADLGPDPERVQEAREELDRAAGQDRELYLGAATGILFGDRRDTGRSI